MYWLCASSMAEGSLDFNFFCTVLHVSLVLDVVPGKLLDHACLLLSLNPEISGS